MLFRGVSKVFNLWSQVARTVCLAYIKKEGRDKKNSPTYRDHISGRQREKGSPMGRFLAEARELCKFNDSHLQLLAALEKLVQTDDKPYDGLISKLVELSGQSRVQVSTFLRLMRLRGHEFSDGPIDPEAEFRLDRRRRLHSYESDD